MVWFVDVLVDEGFDVGAESLEGFGIVFLEGVTGAGW